MHKTFKISTLLWSLLLSACSSWQLHEQLASTEKNNLKLGLWQVRCEAAEKKVNNPKNNYQQAKWLWAIDANNKPIQLSGYLEDGFFIINNSLGKTSLATLQQACISTLAQRSNEKNKSLKLVRVSAARATEKINVPIVFSQKDTQDISRIIVFGDSLSDTGKLKQRTGVLPGAPYWLGRFSNGPVWVDYLEAYSELPIQNHAYGGAFAISHESVPEENVIDKIRECGQLFICGSIRLQVDDFIERSLTNKQLKESEHTLFIIWVGANDYVFKEPLSGVIDIFLNSPEGVSGYKKFVDATIDSLKNNIIQLHQAGAKNFLLPTMPDIGESPIPLQNKAYMSLKKKDFDTVHKIELSKRLSELSNYHNEKLIEMSQKLNNTLSNMKLIVSDTNKNIEYVFTSTSPKKAHSTEQFFDYGFSLKESQRILTADKETLVFQERCYLGGYLGNYLGSQKNSDICKNQENVFFWDVAHPTSYSHCWQAYMLHEGINQAGWMQASINQSDYKSWCLKVFKNNNSSHVGNYIFSKE